MSKMKYYLAIDIGASGGRHILGSVEDGKLKLEEVIIAQLLILIMLPEKLKQLHMRIIILIHIHIHMIFMVS